MPTVELRFSPRAEHVRTARLVAAAFARRVGVDEDLLDEVRLAVGEACSRVVGLHRRHQHREPVTVTLSSENGRLCVAVSDQIPQEAASLPVPVELGNGTALPDLEGDFDNETQLDAMALAVINGLVDDVEIHTGLDGGVVRMSWPASSERAG